MLFSKKFFTALLAVVAVGVNGSPIELEKRDPDKILLCHDDVTFGATDEICPSIGFQEGVCIDITFPENDSTSAVKIGMGLSCSFYT